MMNEVDFKAAANKMFDENVRKFVELKFRWMEEKEVEDFSEYQKAIVETLGKYGLTASKVTKAFTVDITGCENANLFARMKIGTGSASLDFFRISIKKVAK